MKTLTEAQERAVKLCVNSIAEYGSALNSSKTGTGKTVMATHVALKMRCPVAVICPKAVTTHWKREFAEHGIEPLFVTNYEKIRRGLAPFLAKRGKRVMQWNLPADTLLIFDECQRCIREGSLVTLADGSRVAIEKVDVGSKVLTPIGPRRVTNKEYTGISNIVLVSHAEGRLYCTADHEIYTTNRGWIEAGKLTAEDSLLLPRLRGDAEGPVRKEPPLPPVFSESSSHELHEALYAVRGGGNSDPREDEQAPYFLLSGMCVAPPTCEHDSRTEVGTRGNYAGTVHIPPRVSRQPAIDAWGYEPDEAKGYSGKGVGLPDWGPTPPLVGGKRNWFNCAADDLVGGIIGGLGRGILRMGEGTQSLMANHASGPCPTGAKDCGGSGWIIPQYLRRAGARLAEGLVTCGSRLERIAYHQFRDPLRFGRGSFESSRVLCVSPAGTGICYDLSVDEADCFYADGVLVHNCKSPYTQNSLLLISAKMQNVNTLLLSATAAEDCTEMRAIGYALNLHSLNRTTVTSKSWERWMTDHGCWKDEWNSWRSGPKAKLAAVHEVLYRDRAIRLTESDMPEAFRENHIVEEPVDFAAARDIDKFYKEAGITPAIVDAFIEKQTATDKVEDEDSVLVRMLRARQLAEACKIPEIVEMVGDLLEEGNSVAVFLNFRETAFAAKQAVENAINAPVSLVIGGQSSDDRTHNVTEFSEDRRRVIVCTAAAGGTGVDGLQDRHGKYPRVSLISPSFSAQEFKQVLGRLPRAYAKSPVLQKVLVAAGSIEEYVLQAIHRKLANMEALHGA